MACACKKNVNKKYLDAEERLQLEQKKLSGISKIGNVFGQFFFGLIISALFFVGLIPFMGYVIFSTCTGKEMHFRIPNYKKWLKKE